MINTALENLWITAASVLLVLVEAIVATITVCMPDSLIAWFTRKTQTLLEYVPAEGEKRLQEDTELKAKVKEVMEATSFVDMCNIHGYSAQEHVVQTQDGYLLSLHRISGKTGEEETAGRPVIYLHHGLLMNSEIWVAVAQPEQSIAFSLYEAGYDVWLGNNRGNKYSKKHIHYSPSSREFWNFSIDEFAMYDIPDSIRYILNVTSRANLSYLGFSQGSSQAFASLSIHPLLNHHVNTFIALAPAMAPPGIQPSVIQAFMNASPSLLFQIFGPRIILRSTAFWQNIMEPTLFVRIIDQSLRFLFNWKGENITYAQKLCGYNHLYSFTSVKSVVHWFQIIRAGKLQMYDDEVLNHRWLTRFYQPHHYPTRNITTPIHVIYGKSDSLVDLDALVASVPKTTQTYGIDDYEHLDLLWGRAVPVEVIPRILSILQGPVLLNGSSGRSSSIPRRRASTNSQSSRKSLITPAPLF